MAQLFATGIYTTIWTLPCPFHKEDAGLGTRNLLILLIKSNLKTGYHVKGSEMRARDRRTKRDAAFRRGGIYAPKALKKAPNHMCKFLLSTFHGFAFTLLPKHWGVCKLISP